MHLGEVHLIFEVVTSDDSHIQLRVTLELLPVLLHVLGCCRVVVIPAQLLAIHFVVEVVLPQAITLLFLRRLFVLSSLGKVLVLARVLHEGGGEVAPGVARLLPELGAERLLAVVDVLPGPLDVHGARHARATPVLRQVVVLRAIRRGKELQVVVLVLAQAKVLEQQLGVPGELHLDEASLDLLLDDLALVREARLLHHLGLLAETWRPGHALGLLGHGAGSLRGRLALHAASRDLKELGLHQLLGRDAGPNKPLLHDGHIPLLRG
mmetsp:Transcript_35034/g.90009  ORF Transcript_35034/g.90009 Transcript_35034/m.90009 type:complete len:266 (+) Transcript_35034:258-1055(+)